MHGEEDDDGVLLDGSVTNDDDLKEVIGDHGQLGDEKGVKDEKREPSEEGEIDDLEEGELKSDDESVTGSNCVNASHMPDMVRAIFLSALIS